MSFVSILLLSIGLAMDATAVSATLGLAVRKVRSVHVFLVAAFFGGSQALMPLLGWLLGTAIGPLVQDWDHWIAFSLLGLVGGKMLWEARGSEDGAQPTTGGARNPFALRTMAALAVATSIDALAVGVTLPMLEVPLVLSLATIGVTTALLSTCGLFAGRKFGALLGRRLDLAGGVILIVLGIEILVEHLWG